MAQVNVERIREYHIPMNFIDESRVVNGMFKTRNFVEGCILAALVALPAWAGIHAPFEIKISLVVGLALPFFLVGISGINGDPLSTFVKNAVAWSRSRGTMLYNYETRALAQAPIKTMMEQEAVSDKILDFVEAMREKKAKKRNENPLVEGEDFVFAEDKSLAGNYLDEVEEDDEPVDKGPVQSRENEPPAAAVDVEIVDVSVEKVSLTSNVDGPQPEQFELFTAPAGGSPDAAKPAEKPAGDSNMEAPNKMSEPPEKLHSGLSDAEADAPSAKRRPDAGQKQEPEDAIFTVPSAGKSSDDADEDGALF